MICSHCESWHIFFDTYCIECYNKENTLGDDKMNLFLVLAFIFFIGSVSGWILELFYRRFFSNVNPERKWINPGFCTGPYLPLYGSGLCIVYLIACLETKSVIANPFWNKIVLFLCMAVCMTVIEYIAGILSLKIVKVRLWDYTSEWGNIQGIICPKFSFYWALLGAMYYFLIHPHIQDALYWLSRNLAFSFVIGFFFGVFIIDVAESINLVAKLKAYAEENDVIVRYEAIKSEIRRKHDQRKRKYHFFRPFHTEWTIMEHLKELKESFEENKRTRR